jgi:hypothetical protein
MKKILLLSLVAIFVFSGMASAAMKLGVVGSFGTDAWFTHPGLVITPGNNKSINYDILLGYSSIGTGDGNDANVGMLLGGTWWMGQNGPIAYGPTVVYYSQGIVGNPADTNGKAADNTATSLNLVFSAKTALIPSVDVRADVLVYSSVSGQIGGDDIKDSNLMLSTIQLGLQYNFPL